MRGRKKAVFNWSGGKDSAMALQKVLREAEFEVVSLLTHLDRDTHTTTVHALPLPVILQQAASIGIPLTPLFVDQSLSDYPSQMRDIALQLKAKDVTHFIFGDLASSHIRSYRELILSPLNIETVQPLQHLTSAQAMDNFFDSGITATIIMVQAGVLSRDFIGKELNAETVKLFPDGIDICGEAGEYHTLVVEGGPLRSKVECLIEDVGEVSYDIRLSKGVFKTYSFFRATVNCSIS